MGEEGPKLCFEHLPRGEAALGRDQETENQRH